MTTFKLMAIDGTLIDRNNRVPQTNIDQLGLALFVASYNGAKIVSTCADGRRQLLHMPVPTKLASTIIDIAAAQSWMLSFYHDDCLYGPINPTFAKLVDVYEARGKLRYQVVDLESLHGLAPTKLSLVAEPELHD